MPATDTGVEFDELLPRLVIHFSEMKTAYSSYAKCSNELGEVMKVVNATLEGYDHLIEQAKLELHTFEQEGCLASLRLEQQVKIDALYAGKDTAATKFFDPDSDSRRAMDSIKRQQREFLVNARVARDIMREFCLHAIEEREEPLPTPAGVVALEVAARSRLEVGEELGALHGRDVPLLEAGAGSAIELAMSLVEIGLFAKTDSDHPGLALIPKVDAIFAHYCKA